MTIYCFAEILSNLCDNFLEKNVSAILYLTNSELFGRSTASSQYFLQLASYLGIPVIAWNADNSGLERRVNRPTIPPQSIYYFQLLSSHATKVPLGKKKNPVDFLFHIGLCEGGVQASLN